jgi:hypothetical protein
MASREEEAGNLDLRWGAEEVDAVTAEGEIKNCIVDYK